MQKYQLHTYLIPTLIKCHAFLVIRSTKLQNVVYQLFYSKKCKHNNNDEYFKNVYELIGPNEQYCKIVNSDEILTRTE